jgi:hypothetical protein
MRFKLESILILLAILAIFPDGSLVAQTSSEPEADLGFLTPGFDTWVDAFENTVGPDSAWEYPFGAPRPADLSAPEMKIVLSLRRLVLNGSLEELESLTDQVGRRQELMPVQMRFWLSYAQSQLHLNQACLSNLKILLEGDEGWKPLEIGQQAWVMTATADLLFLQGNRAQAAVCYSRLATSPVTQLHLWGKYQLAGMDFLAREFEQSALKYQQVCESGQSGTWREHSCAMAAIASRLGKLGKGGRVDGTVASTTP